jgi:exopolyphosphatase/guanosine-5'-triphosphate,3'-diphosphate pyrophosphatase
LLGYAMRLAYTLSAGTPELLSGTALLVQPGRLVLRLTQGGGAFAGESVLRRLERLALTLELTAVIETMPG